MIHNRGNLLTASFHPNDQQSESNQGQRINKSDEIDSSVRKPKVSPVFFELNEQSSNNNPQHATKKGLNRQASILIRRHRPTVENLSPRQNMNDVHVNQLQHSTVRTKTSRASSSYTKPLNYSKTISENILKQQAFNLKLTHSLQTSRWTPTLAVRENTHTQILSGLSRSKSQSSRHHSSHHHTYQLPSEKSTSGSKQNYIPDLYISSRSMNINNNELEMHKKTNVKDLVDEWEDPKSNVAVLSEEEDESAVTDNSNPALAYNRQINIQQYDPFTSPNFTTDEYRVSSSIDHSKSLIVHLPILRSSSRRRSYSTSLTPVAEHVDDEEIDNEFY